jgi:solute carrier family 35 protein F1/2
MTGVFLNIIQDYDDDKNVQEHEEYPQKLRGDMLAITGGILYGISSVLVEITIRASGDTTEYLGLLGFFALPISITQACLLEWEEIQKFLGNNSRCHSEQWWLLAAYVGCTVFGYMGGSRFFQVSA